MHMTTFRSIETALVFFLTVILAAQDGPEPPTREELRARIDAVAIENGRAGLTFIDRTKSDAERLDAVKELSILIGDTQQEAASRIVLDDTQSVEVRIRALQLVYHRLDNHPDLLGKLLEILKAKDAPLALRQQIATSLQLLFLQAMGRPQAAVDILSVLRSVADDPDSQIRGTALALLVNDGNAEARQMLIDDLGRADVTLLPPSTAVALLANKADESTYVALRKLLDTPLDETTRVETIRALGGDSSSVDRLVRILENPKASEKERLAAAGALYANAPERLPQAGLKVIKDEKAGSKLRVYTINAVGSNEESRSLTGIESVDPDLENFEKALKKLRKDSKSKDVREAAEEYGSEKPPVR